MSATTHSLLVLACLTPSAAGTAQTPSCPGGRASTAVEEHTWVEPHARDVVVKHVFKAITGLGYSFADTAGPFVTAPKFSWPTSVIFKLWRGLVYPGAALVIRLEPTGPWTRIRSKRACNARRVNVHHRATHRTSTFRRSCSLRLMLRRHGPSCHALATRRCVLSPRVAPPWTTATPRSRCVAEWPRRSLETPRPYANTSLPSRVSTVPGTLGSR